MTKRNIADRRDGKTLNMPQTIRKYWPKWYIK